MTKIGSSVVVLVALFLGPARAEVSKEEGLAAFETVKVVLQHPRCLNCHIPGDSPLQLDDGRLHLPIVKRGVDGNGAVGLACSTCHAMQNPPASYGPNMPPGAPSWKLPPPRQKMAWVGLGSGELCRTVKDPKKNGGKTLAALTEHISHDQLVLWGWSPGAGRKPVSVPHDQFVAKWKTWAEAGAPCAP